MVSFGFHYTSKIPFSARFLKTNLRMLGIPELDVVEAEGLDIDGADVEGILEQAKNQARAVAERL